jgi:hypothetical protein
MIAFQDENELQEMKKVHEVLIGERKPEVEQPIVLDYDM